jgi:hypothetical protein
MPKRGWALMKGGRPADLHAHHPGRLGAGHVREEAHVLAERPRHGLRPAAGRSCGQSLAILKEKRYHTGWPNFTSSRRRSRGRI